MKLKVIIAFSCLCALWSAPILSADETWQGNAAVSLRGELDRDGYYAASNSFPPGTKILVTNLANSRNVVVTVRQRLNGASNVFLLLSSRAANELGMSQVDIARIKTQVVGLSTDLTGGVTDFTYNRDSDTNPAHGTPDAATIQPEDRTTAIAENTPAPSPTTSPTPLPSPTPAVDTTVKDPGLRDPEKDRFAAPAADQEGEVTWRRAPAREDREKITDVALNEARVPVKEKGEAVVITRPRTPERVSESLALADPEAPTVGPRKKDLAVIDEYRPFWPEEEDVVAILIEPREIPRETIAVEEGAVIVFERPTLDRETVTAALNDPVLLSAERPFVWELHDVTPAGEELALADPILPEAVRGDQAAVDAYARMYPDRDRVALETFLLPERQGKDAAEVNALARANPDKETTDIASHQLPAAGEKEKADVLERAAVGGRDKKSPDLAIAPVDPRPVTKPKTDRTIITVRPDNTDVVKTTPGPDKTVTVAPVWDATDYTKNFYYLQVGVFASRETADRIIKANPSYPMRVVTGRDDNQTVYKVVVGPLKRDETGTVLYLFRARGYRDAFLRYIE